MASATFPFALDVIVAGENLCGLPDEIWLKILRMYRGGFPNIIQLLRLGRVSKKMYLLTKDASLWTEISIDEQFPPLQTFKSFIDWSTKLRKLVLTTTYKPYKEMITYAMEKRGDTIDNILIECSRIECMYGAPVVLTEVMEPIQSHGVALRRFLISGRRFSQVFGSKSK